MSQQGLGGETARAEALATGWSDKEETFRHSGVGVKSTLSSSNIHRYRGHGERGPTGSLEVQTHEGNHSQPAPRGGGCGLKTEHGAWGMAPGEVFTLQEHEDVSLDP